MESLSSFLWALEVPLLGEERRLIPTCQKPRLIRCRSEELPAQHRLVLKGPTLATQRMGEHSCMLHSGELDLKKAECEEFSGLGLPG